MSFNKLFRRGVKHILFVACSAIISLMVLHYFSTTEQLASILTSGPSDHPILFGWFVFTAAILYINFSWFREQLCLIVCPYGRLQSVLIDDDSLVIGYDRKRGEPRGKVSDENNGDCISCNRCVVVCPTGIDIRNGLQLECIGCAACIDACDEIMEKVNRPKGLVRYDSLNGLEHKAKRILRPRIYLYTVLLFIGALVSGSFALQRSEIEVTVLRLSGPPYEFSQEMIRNKFEIHVFNKSGADVTIQTRLIGPDGIKFVQPFEKIELKRFTDRHMPVFAQMPKDLYRAQFPIRVQILENNRIVSDNEILFLGPSKN